MTQHLDVAHICFLGCKKPNKPSRSARNLAWRILEGHVLTKDSIEIKWAAQKIDDYVKRLKR